MFLLLPLALANEPPPERTVPADSLGGYTVGKPFDPGGFSCRTPVAGGPAAATWCVADGTATLAGETVRFVVDVCGGLVYQVKATTAFYSSGPVPSNDPEGRVDEYPYNAASQAWGRFSMKSEGWKITDSAFGWIGMGSLTYTHPDNRTRKVLIDVAPPDPWGRVRVAVTLMTVPAAPCSMSP